MTISFPEFNAGRSGAAEPDFGSLATHTNYIQPKRPGVYRNVFKRVLDVTAIMLAAPVVVPVVFGLALVIARNGGKPFYTQMRVGKDGRRFKMWKLRTMVCDADERMEDYLASNPQARLEWDSTQKLKSDPRITSFGKFLRKSSLDELPQLWNVFVGEMSLVGPRPMMINQQSMYPGLAYYALRPGITGYWQTAGRNRTTFEARAEYDAAYEANVTLATDLCVLVQTVGVVVNATGY